MCFLVFEYQLALTILYAYLDKSSGEFLQFVLCTVIPSLTVTKPNMSSPGIGLQHLEKEYFIFSFLPSNSINFSPDTIDSYSESDFPMSNSISVFFDLVLTSLR